LASLYIPVIYVKARKFALLFTLGSLLIIFSLSMFRGPGAFVKHLMSRQDQNMCYNTSRNQRDKNFIKLSEKPYKIELSRTIHTQKLSN